MNTHGRAGDCTVILINCTLNPVEMDHRLGAIISRSRTFERRQIIHKEGDINGVIIQEDPVIDVFHDAGNKRDDAYSNASANYIRFAETTDETHHFAIVISSCGEITRA